MVYDGKTTNILQAISSSMRLPEDYLKVVERSSSYRYMVYEIQKRNGTGTREIAHPARELKAIQRWLLDNVIRYWPVHASATAYEPGRTLAAHARLHVGAISAVRVDFANFFPSITSTAIAAFLYHASWDPINIRVFCDFVCRFGKLSIGSPSSPSLANALLFGFDSNVSAWAAEHGIRYSRYADDLMFSSSSSILDVASLLVALRQALDIDPWSKCVEINHKKTWMMRRGHVQVTGIHLPVNNALALSVGRHRKRWIRSMIKNVAILTAEERMLLAGLLAFLNSVEPATINRLVLKYGAKAVTMSMKPRIS